MAPLSAELESLKSEQRELRDKIEQLATSVTDIQATIRSWKLIGTVGAILFAVLTSFGFKSVVDSLANLRSDLASADKQLATDKAISRDYALVTQKALIGYIDANFDSIESLDALGLDADKPVLNKIEQDSAKLREVAQTLPEGEASTYYLVGQSVQLYLHGRCDDVLETLAKVSPGERDHFIYYYMRGVCNLRAGHNQVAQQDFATARTLAGGRQSMAENASAALKLFEAHAAKNQTLAQEAIVDLRNLIAHDPRFVPAYMNLACAYAEVGDYPRATEYLQKQVRELSVSPDDLLKKIDGDLIRPHESFLGAYVRQYLGVTALPGTAEWNEAMRKSKLQL